MSKILITILLVTSVITATSWPANSAEKRFPEVLGLDEALDICKKTKDAFHMVVPMISPLVLGLETQKAPAYDYCVMLNELVKDLEHARQLQRKMNTISLNDTKMNQAHALAMASFALSQSPVNFQEMNDKQLMEIKRKRAGKKMAGFYSMTRNVNILDPNASGDSNVDEAKGMVKNFSDLSRRRSVIRELASCPVPNNESEKNDANQVSAEMEEEDIARELRDVYFQKLNDAAKLFPKEYRKDLKTLHRKVTNIKFTNKTKIGDDGVEFTYQLFYAVVENDALAFDKFLEKYDTMWNSIVKRTRSGILNSMETATKCDMLGSNQILDIGNSVLKPISKNCLQKQVEKSESYQLQFFRNNFAQYRMWTMSQANLKAQILSRESEILKAPIFYSDSSITGSSTVPKPASLCNKELSMAAMEQARLKSKAISSEYRAIAAEMLERKVTLEQLREEKAYRERVQADQESKAARRDPKRYWQMMIDLKGLEKVR